MNAYPETRHPILQVHLLLMVVQICFAILPTFSKIAFRTFSPESVAFFRIVCSAVLFAGLFFGFFFEKLQSRRHLLHFAGLSVFGTVLNQYLFIKGVSFTTAINASILISIIPIFTLIFGVLAKEESITFKKLVGVLIAFLGVLVILDFGDMQLTGYLKGNILILLNAMSYSLYLVISKPILERYRPFTVITYIFIFATFQIIPLTIAQVTKISFAAIPLADYRPLLIIVIFSTFIPYTLSTMALKRTYSSIVAVYTYLHPLLGASFAAIILGESVTIVFVFAGGLILLGVSLVSFQKLPVSIKRQFKFIPPSE